MQTLLKIIFVFFEIGLFGQIDVRNFDYSKADSIALNFPKRKYKSYTEIIFPLTDSLKTDHEKFRAIFRWITDNIQYSYSNMTTNPDKIIKKGKTSCGGYASLLETMCRSVGLNCIVIKGYSKTKLTEINKDYKRIDHGWNAIKLYNNWYLVDATWASGYMDSKSRKFVKEYNDSYYLTDPEFFYLKHFPKDKSLFLTENTVRLRNFKKSPVFHEGLIVNGIEEIFPKNGEIKIKLSDSLKIKIQSKVLLENFGISLNNNRYYYYPNISFKRHYYILKQKFDRPGTYAMTIFVDGSAIATYRLIIKKNWP